MKQRKLLPIVAVISGLMVGCGGGGGGGGGGAPTKTSFTFKFAIPAVMQKSEAAAQNCTVYDRKNDVGGNESVLTYSAATTQQVTNYILGYYSDTDGKRVGDIIKPSSDSFRFYLEDIPEGGYITFQAEEFNGKETRVNSFSKAFLKDKSLRNATFALNRDSLNKCFTGGNQLDHNFRNLSYLNEVSGGSDYHYVSQFDTFVSPNPKMLAGDELPGVRGEPTVLFQYVDDSNLQLHQYGVGSWAGTDIQLVATNLKSNILTSSAYDYDKLSIGFVANNYLYDALELGKGVADYARPADTNGETWVYMANDDATATRWQTLLTGTVPAGWDIDLDTDAYLNIDNLPNTKPSVGGQGGAESVIDLAMGLNASTEGYSRTAYFSASDVYKVTHRIYTTSTNDEVVVPELYYYNFPSSAIEALKVSDLNDFNRTALILGDDHKLNAQMFVSFFANGDASEPELDADLDGILSSELQGRENEVSLRSSNGLVVTRFN
ncbi:54K polar flagellar sheath protein A [Vibrio sp. CAU 1672]|uniref:54K polar flagellar sheath protein A n=1 Tax=Vibrio sp. CAU 1672 TaxID=3032594 RepID=UPI0023DA9EE0|nr:54K polar flagellar sheath protein A [Vibrio sp. CAU 1672]MDF2153645.1 54K polar flagellar sheath protein A [Vibrio sp. CAU 1672]